MGKSSVNRTVLGKFSLGIFCFEICYAFLEIPLNWILIFRQYGFKLPLNFASNLLPYNLLRPILWLIIYFIFLGCYIKGTKITRWAYILSVLALVSEIIRHGPNNWENLLVLCFIIVFILLAIDFKSKKAQNITFYISSFVCIVFFLYNIADGIMGLLSYCRYIHHSLEYILSVWYILLMPIIYAGTIVLLFGYIWFPGKYQTKC